MLAQEVGLQKSLRSRDNDFADTVPVGDTEIRQLETWTNVLPTLSALLRMLTEHRYEPTPKHLHVLISILSDESYSEFPQIDSARATVSTFFRCVCIHYSHFIPILIEYGLLDAGIRLFPRYQVSWFLSYLARDSYIAASRIVESGIPSRIPEACASEPSPSDQSCHIRLAGVLSEYTRFHNAIFPLVPMILESTLTDNLGLRCVSLRSLARMLRNSTEISQEVVSSQFFPQILETTKELDLDEDVISATAAFFGALLHNAGVCSLQIMRALVAILAKMLVIVQSEACREEIIDAIGYGNQNGPPFVEFCAEFGIVEFLFTEYRSERSFHHKTIVIDALISLFRAAEYRLQEMFVQAGLFDIMISDGLMLIDDVSYSISFFISAVLEAAAAHANETWLDFVQSPVIIEILTILQDSEDVEVRYLARDIMNGMQKCSDFM